MNSGTPTGGVAGAAINDDITTTGGRTETKGMVIVLRTRREASKKVGNRCSIGDRGRWVVGREDRSKILPLNQEDM